MQTFEQIQFQIGAWNVKTFGRHETPHLHAYEPGTIKHNYARAEGERPGARRVGLVVALGSLAPLMGIMEEVGELMAADEDAERTHDALGDIAVYLCDYCCRENIPYPARAAVTKKAQYASPGTGLVVYLGHLYHCHLKRYQRIRGYHDPGVFSIARAEALRGFVWHLEAFTKKYTSTNLLTILNQTWNQVVKKRKYNEPS